jgi:hypothetical protein
VPKAIAERATILKILAVPATIIVIVLSTVLLGSTSHEKPTGKIAGIKDAVVVTLRFDQEVNPSKVEIAATIDPSHDFWGRFFVQPKHPMATFTGASGFAHFVNHQWQVVTFGSSEASCPRDGRTPVPRVVLGDFLVSCPPE